MAESAQSPATTTATVSPNGTGIKQEATGLEGLGLSMSPEIAAKRPLESAAQEDDRAPDPKRVKTENEPEGGEGSVEDGLAALIQNTLSNINDLVGHASEDPEPAAPASDPMEVESVPAPEPTPAPPAPVTFSSDPEKFIRNVNLHALGNLALSLLLVLTQRPADETSKLLRQGGSEHARALRKLNTAFGATRDLYSYDPVLVVDPPEPLEADNRTIIELANLSKLGAWLIDGDSTSLADADANFLSMFPSQLSDLPWAVSELYLAVKTQRAVQALSAKAPEKPSSEIIAEALMDGMEAKLRERAAGEELDTVNQVLASSLKTREAALREQTEAEIGEAALEAKYPYADMLRHFNIYVKGRLASATELGEKLGVTIPIADDEPAAEEDEAQADESANGLVDLDDLSSFFEKTTTGLVQNALAGLTEEEAAAAETIEDEDAAIEASSASPKPPDPTSQTNDRTDFMTDYKELEALVAESTADYVKTTLNGLSPMPYQPTVPSSTAESMAAQSPYLSHLQQHQPQSSYYPYSQPNSEHQPPQPGPGGLLPPNQSLSSAMLYDKARQAALSKSSAHTRREGLHSTRRPWSQEEEKALMAGLDMVKGPHWSQILTLFGQNGTISDILKERTQVQLKDKARNLKLFFLKTNSEMPYYLQAVTGELKTRAPTQAARKEAEERARLNSEEDQAKLQGIMALAGGLQHPPQSRASESPAASMPSSVVTPAQAAAAQASSSGQAAAGLHAASPATPTPSTGQAASAVTSAQPKPFGQATGQQAASHSTPQAPPRPQSLLPPHIPRPQTQQQHQQPQSQPQNNSSPQPAAIHPTTSQPESSTTPLTQSTQPMQQPAATTAAQPQLASSSTTAPSYPSPPVAKPAQPTRTSQAPPTPPPPAAVSQPAAAAATATATATQDNENSAEAALLKGLQAAVAETTS